MKRFWWKWYSGYKKVREEKNKKRWNWYRKNYEGWYKKEFRNRENIWYKKNNRLKKER